MQMELPVTLTGWIFLGLAAIVTAVVAIASRYGINLAQANIKNILFDRLCQWARTYVAALAQDPSLDGLASEEKKERAMFWLVSKAAELGIVVTEDEASKLIEEAVWILKNSTLPAIEAALE
jgi:hypothetical protein